MQSRGLRGADKWSTSLRMHAVKKAAVLSHLVGLALATQHHTLPVVTRFVFMGVLWVTWQLQSLGTAASSPARGTVKWLGGRPPVRQTGRDVAELHYVVDAAMCAVVFDDHVALDDGVPRARTSAVRACRTTLECVAFFRKHKALVKLFSSTVAFLSSARTCGRV